MVTFKIHTNYNTYYWNNKSIFGDISIEVDGIFLPDENWTDVVSGVLNIWVSSLINLLKKDLIGEYNFYFMDGSYYFRITGEGTQKITFAYFENEKRVERFTYEVNVIDIINEILNILNVIIKDERFKDVMAIKGIETGYKKLLRIMRRKL